MKELLIRINVALMAILVGITIYSAWWSRKQLVKARKEMMEATKATAEIEHKLQNLEYRVTRWIKKK